MPTRSGDGAHEGRAALPTRFADQPPLDGLRAVAVGAVLVFHFGSGELPGGFLGVDLFFVLSGYLITSLLLVEWARRARIDLRAFWSRRARRLLPALVLALAAIGVWARLALPSDQLPPIRADGLWTLFYGANWHFITAGRSYFASVSTASPLRHAWSLAIEEQFYLVWPPVTLGCLWLAKGRTWLLSVVCVVAAAASVMAMGLLSSTANPNRAYYGTDTRAQALLVGALLAVVLARREGRAVSPAVQPLGVAAASVCVALFAVASDHAGWMYPSGFLLFAVAAGAVILAVVQPVRTPLRALLSLPPVRWVGRISYGLYLWHWPVAVALSPGATRLGGWDLVVVRVAVTFTAATLSYYLVERPIRERRFLLGWRARVAVPVGAATAAGVLLVGTAGATSPPRYLVASPTKVVPTDSPRPAATPTTDAVAPPPGPVLLLGDSIAETLALELGASAASHGVSLVGAVRPGCGVITGTPLEVDGTVVPWGAGCADSTAPYEEQAVASAHARVIVVLSSWEDSDRLVDGHAVSFDTPTGDQVWFQLLDGMRARLDAGGATIVLVEMPPPATFSDAGPADPDQLRRMVALGSLYRSYVAARPGVELVDLASIVCPGGPPCPEYVDGVRLRPTDGIHFQQDGAAWVAPRLYDALARALDPVAKQLGPP